MDKYLAQTPLLNYSQQAIQQLILEKNWQEGSNYHKIQEIYDFVRNEILFGYNKSDNLPAAQVLLDGYGQCNTKSTLFMALLRAVGIPCCIQGFWIDKSVQKGIVPAIVYTLAPKQILHTWVDVYYEGTWYSLEGLIVDAAYISRIQQKFTSHKGPFCGFGIAAPDLFQLETDWKQCSTYIQKEAITEALGIFDSPDALYQAYAQKLSCVKQLLYSHWIRHRMNKACQKIRTAP